jgi:hypothetical protein
MKTVNYSLAKFNKNLTKTLLISMLTTTAIVTGVIPDFSFDNGKLSFSNIVLAQSEEEEEELKRYAQALSEIEKLRQTTLTKIESIVDSNQASQVACNKPSSISVLSAEARKVANNYCGQSEAIVKKHGFSNAQVQDFMP